MSAISLRATLILLGLALMVAAPAADAKRVALVIGNDSYESAAPLQNARSDARAVAEVLRRDGFDVALKEDVTLKAMKDALRSFKAQIAGGDDAVFYFSGHGVQFEGTNYLIPIDLTPDSQEQVVDDSLSLQRVLDDLRDQKARFALAIVDACRDNPFRGTGRAIGSRGLAPVTAATGQMIMYSAGAGQQALDRLGSQDSDPHGVFTRVLIKELEKPGEPADQMLKNVRNQVVSLARAVDHEQVPALYDQTVGEFYFVANTDGKYDTPAPPPANSTAAADAFAALAAARSKNERQKIEQNLWEQLRKSLPMEVTYGILPAQGGDQAVVSFEPSATQSDGQVATVRSMQGQPKNGRLLYDHAVSIDYRIDCAKHEYVVIRNANHNGVTYPDAAAQKKGAYISADGTGQESLAQALCDLPLRIIPLWGLAGIEWTGVGDAWSAALKVTWTDPKRAKQRYVLTRHDLPQATPQAATVTYGWTGIDCATHESRNTGFYEATASGEIVKVTGWPPAWEKFGPTSVSQNVYVLLCER
jgi:uncharacterized caspase-like protein